MVDTKDDQVAEPELSESSSFVPVSTAKVDTLLVMNEGVKVLTNDDASSPRKSEPNDEHTRNGLSENVELMAVGEGHSSLEQSKSVLVSDMVLNLGCNFRKKSARLGHAVMAVMLLSNILNYMDRFTIAGVLNDVKTFYNISNAQVGLLQTSFIVTYMVFSPVFGYVGDRFNRKLIISAGIAVWCGTTLISSFVGPDHFIIFLLLRGVLGIGETCFATIAPTILADMFDDSYRTIAISIFYLAIPVGSGLGYIIGAYTAQLMGDWRWSLRVTPIIGVVCLFLTLIVVKEPQRGAAEGGTNLKATSWKADLKYLVNHKSFMLSSGAFTCVSFVAGALAFWAPLYMSKSIRVQPTIAYDAEVSLIFGVITCLAGFSGVAIGTLSAKKLRTVTQHADPLICAFGMITGAPFLLLALTMSRYNTLITWIFIYLGETLISLNWALVTDILMYIIIPTRRSTATAVQILMSHALGDAGSPYVVGLISDAVQNGYGREDLVVGFVSMQYALYMNCFVCVLGGGFFLATALYIQQDRQAAASAIKDAAKLTAVDDQIAAGEKDPAAMG